MKARILPLSAVTMLVPAAALAAGPTEVLGGGSVLPSLLRLLGAFVLVIALVFTCSVVFRRLTSRRRGGGTRAMNVLDVLPLGAKSRLVTVKIGRRVYVIGAGESSVNRIADMEEDEYQLVFGDDEVPVVPFKERLLKLARK